MQKQREVTMSTVIHKRVEECRNGTNPKAICRVHSGWVVIGDVQFLRGYSLILPDPVVADLNMLGPTERTTPQLMTPTGMPRSCRASRHISPGQGSLSEKWWFQADPVTLYATFARSICQPGNTRTAG